MEENKFASSENTSKLSLLDEMRLRKMEENAELYQAILNETKEELIRKAYQDRINQINAEIDRMKGRVK